MENILIQFQSDTSGIDTSVNALQKLGQIDKATAEQFTKTNQSLNERNKALSSTSTAINNYANTLKSAQAASVGVFGTEAIKQYEEVSVSAFDTIIRKIDDLKKDKASLENSGLKSEDAKLYNLALEQVTKNLKDLQAQLSAIQGENPLQSLEAGAESANVATKTLTQGLTELQRQLAAKQVAVKVELDVDKIETYNQEIKQLEDEIEKLNTTSKTVDTTLTQSFTQSTEKTTTFRTQLLQMRQELIAMSESGATFSIKYNQSFEQLQQSAAALQDDIGDINARVTALSSDTASIDAVVQGFGTLAAGGQIAAGAMGLVGDENADLQKTLVQLNSVMAISSGIQQIVNDLQAESILRLKLEAAYTSLVGASNTATAATFRFLGVSVEETSLAFKGMRTAIALTGIGALIIGVIALSNYMSRLDPLVQNADKSLQELGDTVSEITDTALKNLKEDVKSLNEELGIKTPSSVELARKALKLLQDQADEIGKHPVKDFFDISPEGWMKTFRDIGATFGIVEDQMTENAKKQAEFREQIAQHERLVRLKGATDLLNDTFSANREGAKSEAELQIAKNDAILNDEKASYAARLTALQDNLKQRKVIIAADLDLTLSQTTSEPKRAVAKKEADNEITKAQIDFNQRMGDLQQTNANTAKEIAEHNAEAIFQITQRHLQQESEAYKSFSESDSFDYDARLRFLQTYISKETALLQLQRDKELSSENITSTQRENIIDKYNTDVEQLTLTGLVTRNSIIKAQNDAAKAQDAQFYADVKANQEKQAAEIVKNVNALYAGIGKNNIAEQINLLKQLEDAYKNGSISLEQYQQQRNAISRDFDSRDLNNQISALQAKIANLRAYGNDVTDLEAELQDKLKAKYDQDAQNFADAERQKSEAFQEEQERRQALRDAEIQLGATVVQGLFEVQRSAYQNEAQEAQDLYDKKLITQKEYDARSRDIRRKQAAVDKEEALFNIALSTAEGVANALSKVATIPLVPFILAQGLVQAAVVLAKPIPKYRHGKVSIDGEGTETSDSIPAMLSKGETVITARQTRKHTDALTAIHEDRFESWLKEKVEKKFAVQSAFHTYSETNNDHAIDNRNEKNSYHFIKTYHTTDSHHEADSYHHSEEKTSNKKTCREQEQYFELLKTYQKVMEAITVLQHFSSLQSERIAIIDNNVLNSSDFKLFSSTGSNITLDSLSAKITAFAPQTAAFSANFDMPELKMPDYGVLIPALQMAQVNDDMMQQRFTHNHTHSSTPAIDYDKLGASVAKHVGKLEDMKQVDISIDEDGWRKKERQKNIETEFVNNYYSTKGTHRK